MNDDLVTITRYRHRDAADHAQETLGDAGIEARVDEVPRAVSLRVDAPLALAAGEVLNARYPSIDELFEAEESSEAPTTCARCGSANLRTVARTAIFAVLAATGVALGAAAGVSEVAFLAIPAAAILALVADRRRCADCGATR